MLGDVTRYDCPSVFSAISTRMSLQSQMNDILRVIYIYYLRYGYTVLIQAMYTLPRNEGLQPNSGSAMPNIECAWCAW